MMHKIALIGFGNWGKILLPHLRKRFDIVHVYGRSIEPKGIFTNCLDKALDSRAEAVVIATSINTHFDIVREALLRNKHIFCEKPLTTVPQQTKELIAIADSKKLQLVTDYTYTFSKRLLEVQAGLVAGNIGRLHTVLMTLRRDIRDREAGVYWILASHLMAILGMFIDLSRLKFEKKEYALGQCAHVLFKGEIEGALFVDMAAVNKKTEVILHFDEGRLEFVDLVQDDNLGYALEYFDEVLDGKVNNEANLAISSSVADVLWELQGKRIRHDIKGIENVI